MGFRLRKARPQVASSEQVRKLVRRLATHDRCLATLTEVLDVVNACFDARQ